MLKLHPRNIKRTSPLMVHLTASSSAPLTPFGNTEQARSNVAADHSCLALTPSRRSERRQGAKRWRPCPPPKRGSEASAVDSSWIAVVVLPLPWCNAVLVLSIIVQKQLCRQAGRRSTKGLAKCQIGGVIDANWDCNLFLHHC